MMSARSDWVFWQCTGPVQCHDNILIPRSFELEAIPQVKPFPGASRTVDTHLRSSNSSESVNLCSKWIVQIVRWCDVYMCYTIWASLIWILSQVSMHLIWMIQTIKSRQRWTGEEVIGWHWGIVTVNALLLKGKISFFQSAGRLKFDLKIQCFVFFCDLEKGHTPVKHGLCEGEPKKIKPWVRGHILKYKQYIYIYIYI